jgi:integrase
MKATSIDRVGERQKLLPRREPYWGPHLAANQHLGYRKIAATRASWIARLKKDRKRSYQKLGFETNAFGYDQALAAAREWFAHMAAIEKGTVAAVVVADADLTVRDACDAYVISMRDQKKRPGTAHDAQKRFERVVYKRPLAKVKLTQLCKQDVQDWLDKLDMTPASLARTFTSLRAALNLAIRRERVGVAARQSWVALELPAVPDNRRTRFLDLKERRALLNACQGGLKDLVQGALLTGARAGELTSALCRQLDARTGHMVFAGKTGRRTVALSTAALKLFVRLAKNKRPDDYLFVRDDGLKWNHSDWDEKIKAAAKQAGLPDDVVLYSCRHTFISQTISDGLNVLEVARMVGTSLKMIDKHYGHLAQKETVARLSKVRLV